MGSSLSFAERDGRALRSVGWGRPVLLVSRCLCILLVLFLVMSLWTPSSQASETKYVDGISDPHLTAWEGNFEESSFRSFFQENWVNDEHIKFARIIIKWQGEKEQLDQWLTDVTAMGLTPDIAVTVWKPEKEGVPLESFPGETEYKDQLKEIIKAATKASGGTVYIEPWNEPNAQGELGVGKGELGVGKSNSLEKNIELAAEFANWANGVCSKPECTVVAGNFEDTETVETYAKGYISHLKFKPEDWGIHPYKAIENDGEKGEEKGGDTNAVDLANQLRIPD